MLQVLGFSLEILPALTERNIGVIGMKSLAGDGTSIFKTEVTAQEAISYSLSLHIHTLVSGMDSLDILSQNLAIVRKFQPLSEKEREALLTRVSAYAHA